LTRQMRHSTFQNRKTCGFQKMWHGSCGLIFNLLGCDRKEFFHDQNNYHISCYPEIHLLLSWRSVWVSSLATGLTTLGGAKRIPVPLRRLGLWAKGRRQLIWKRRSRLNCVSRHTEVLLRGE